MHGTQLVLSEKGITITVHVPCWLVTKPNKDYIMMSLVSTVSPLWPTINITATTHVICAQHVMWSYVKDQLTQSFLSTLTFNKSKKNIIKPQNILIYHNTCFITCKFKDYTHISENKLSSAWTWSVNIVRHSQKIHMRLKRQRIIALGVVLAVMGNWINGFTNWIGFNSQVNPD